MLYLINFQSSLYDNLRKTLVGVYVKVSCLSKELHNLPWWCMVEWRFICRHFITHTVAENKWLAPRPFRISHGCKRTGYWIFVRLGIEPQHEKKFCACQKSNSDISAPVPAAQSPYWLRILAWWFSLTPHLMLIRKLIPLLFQFVRVIISFRRTDSTDVQIFQAQPQYRPLQNKDAGFNPLIKYIFLQIAYLILSFQHTMQQDVSSKMFNRAIKFYYSINSLTTTNIYTHLHNHRAIRSQPSTVT